MGMHAFPAKMLGKIPTYYITDTVQEDAGSGNIRVLNYARINGVLVPQFVCIVASAKLMVVSRKLADIAQAIFDSEQLRLPSAKVH